MQIVITMAGLGTRFKKAGYDKPKYEIEVHGRTLFSWSMESLEGLRRPGDDHYFIVRRADDARSFILSEWEKIAGTDNAHVIELDEMTDGQATTAMLAAPYWKKEDSLLIYHIDTYVEKGCMNLSSVEVDGFIPCFNALGDHWSFVEVNGSGDAVAVREKQRISDNCTLGAYYFRTCDLYERMYKEYYGAGSNMEKGEKYVAPLYNHMIGKGMKVRISLVDAARVHVLGTPEELKVFAEADV